MNPPLAERLRPRTLDELRGQSRILGADSLLRRSLEQDTIPSLILWGPPGCGKTSLAHVIQGCSRKIFVALSAVSSGVKDVKETISQARSQRALGQSTILFIDEIHRFNRSQQDALLGAVEDGTVTLIGATTENPSFEINNALLSRCQLILFSPLSMEELEVLFWSALRDHPRGLCRKDLEIAPSVVQKIIRQAEGDARYLLNQLEWIEQALESETKVDDSILEKIQFQKPLRYDKQYDEHYNVISVFHKSVRGSDPHAALYWLHRMLQGGEDPRYILRRLMRMAMEDIGLADPQALRMSVDARATYDFLGSPEGLLALDQLTTYLCLAPKSNAMELASMAAENLVRIHGTLPVPKAFRNADSATGRKLGYGQGYLYDHDSPDAYSGQDHMPVNLQGTKLYQPTEYGLEKRCALRLQDLENLKQQRTK